MLIPSHRHTPEDLRLWAELEAGDRAYAAARADRLARLADAARDAVRAFAERGPCYCGVSWGKDSVVVAHLVMQVAARIPLVWVVVPGQNPDCGTVRDAFLARWPEADYHEIHVVRGAHRTSGRGFAEADRRFGARHISGLRAEESGGRTISMRHRGLATTGACRPIGWWSGADVFALMAAEGLPVHPAYAMLGAGRWPRRHLRVASLGGRRGNQYGRAEWEREYYGDVLNRLSRR